MKSIKLSEVCLQAALHALTIQAADGSFPSGHNGSYFDPETSVRNTAHWLYLFASLYLKTGDDCWKVAGENAIEFLKSPKVRPFGSTFHCRDKVGKDRCNGLIGQAWVIEALCNASEAFGRRDCYKLAEDVFLLHPWDENIGIWRRVDVDGTLLSFDSTFNHQLWFAAAGSLLTDTSSAKERAEIFLNKVAERVQLYPDGVIFHESTMGRLRHYFSNGTMSFLREFKSRIGSKTRTKGLYSKSVGYHGFNLYALAMLKTSFPSNRIWNTGKFTKLINAHRKEKFCQNVTKSEFGYRYNVSGIEIAFAIETFFQDKQEATMWLNKQMAETFLNDTQPLSLGATDPNTAMARIYQAARLVEDYEVVFDKRLPNQTCNL